jgi:predicted nuclease with TOPRIM domain
MSKSNDELYQKRISELEAENARLRDSLEVAITERRQLRERVYGQVKEEDLPTEEDYIELMRNHVPGSGMKFLAELGLWPRKSK